MRESYKRLLQPIPHPVPASTVLLVMRLVVGSAFIIHGWPKIQNPFAWMGPQYPFPGFFQLLTAVTGSAGGAPGSSGSWSRSFN